MSITIHGQNSSRDVRGASVPSVSLEGSGLSNPLAKI